MRGGNVNMRQLAERRTRVDAYAEALAETGSTALAAARTDTPLATGRSYFRQIKAELGWQAA